MAVYYLPIYKQWQYTIYLFINNGSILLPIYEQWQYITAYLQIITEYIIIS